MSFKFDAPYEQWVRGELKQRNFNESQITAILSLINASCDRLLTDLVSHFTVNHSEVDAMKLPDVPEVQRPAFRNGCKYMIDYYNDEVAAAKKQFGIS